MSKNSIKKFAVILFILTFVGSIAIKAQTDWTGFYEFMEDGGKTAGGSAIIINHSIEIRESADGLMAIVQSNGFQTSVNLICTAKTENNKLMIYFADYGEDNMFESYKEGDLLLTLEKNNKNEILTHWGKFQPSVDKNEKSGKVYFKKTTVSKKEIERF